MSWSVSMASMWPDGYDHGGREAVLLKPTVSSFPAITTSSVSELMPAVI